MILVHQQSHFRNWQNCSHHFLAGFLSSVPQCSWQPYRWTWLKASYSFKHPLIRWKWKLIQSGNVLLWSYRTHWVFSCMYMYMHIERLECWCQDLCLTHLFVPCAVWLALIPRKEAVVLAAAFPGGKWVRSAPVSHAVGISTVQEFVSLKLLSKWVTTLPW